MIAAMGGRLRAALAVLSALLTLALFFGAQSADAITRSQADRIAMRVLKPQRLSASDGVVLLGLPRPLKASDDVNQAKPGKSWVPVLGKREWLFWLDPGYGLQFSHPSTILLIDNRTGRVVTKKKIEWWPLVDGKRPAFFTGEPQRESGADRRYRVYAHLPASRFTAAERASRSNRRRLRGPIAHASNTYADSCLVMAGNFGEFPKDFNNIEAYFKGFGVTPYRMPNTEELSTFIKNLPSTCKDVIIFLSGHEGSEGGIIAGPKKVRRKKLEIDKDGKHVIGYEETEEDAIISIKSITGAIKENATRTFKVIVDACYSGLIVNAIGSEHLTNALIAVASSGATEKSWAFYRGGFTKGLIEGMKEGETAAKEDTTGVDPIARLIEEGTKHPHGVFSGSWKTSSSLYSCGKEEVIFNNTNGEGVENGGFEPMFTAAKVYCLVSISTYHWNSEQGTAKAGKIGLKYSGGELGPYQAVGEPGERAVPNANWIVTLPTTDPVILKAGTAYSCDDSDRTTWSQDKGTGGAGFCKVTVRVAEPK